MQAINTNMVVDKKQMEILKRDMRIKIRQLRLQNVEEDKNVNFFQQERERINYLWMLQKKKIEDSQADLVNKKRELEDLEEKHKIENKLYMQKIKFLMLKQQDENVELQKEAEIALKQMEDSHRVKERDYKYDIRTLSQIQKEQEVNQNDFIHALEKDQIKAIHQLKGEFELKEFQLRRFYRDKIRELQTNMEEKRKKIINDINEKKKKEIDSIIKTHLEAFEAMKNYYSDFNKKNLNNLKKLAEKISEQLTTQNKQNNEKLYLSTQKKKIEDPLVKLEEEIKRQKEKKNKCKENFKKLTQFKNEYGRLMEELLELEYKYEVTLQKIHYLEKEKGSFTDKYKDNLHLLEQKAGLRNLILEKKLETIEDNIEIKDAQLKELMKLSAIDPAALANMNNTLEEIELMKGESINQLEEELKKLKESHINMIKTYESKLAEFGIPVEEMGFEPLIPVDIQKSG